MQPSLGRWKNPTIETHYTYNSWVHMRDRCYNPDADQYEYYGGRGITVCDRWRYNYDAFVDDMGFRPNGTTIERIDNDEGYYPLNCCWASMSEQIRNRRNAHLVTHRGVTKSVVEWAETLDISWSAFRQYVRRKTVTKNIDRLIGQMEF